MQEGLKLTADKTRLVGWQVLERLAAELEESWDVDELSMMTSYTDCSVQLQILLRFLTPLSNLGVPESVRSCTRKGPEPPRAVVVYTHTYLVTSKSLLWARGGA